MQLFDKSQAPSCDSNLYSYIAGNDGLGRNRTSACFGKGIFLGDGTVVRGSTSAGGGGAIAAVLCDITLHGAILEENSATSGDGGALLLSGQASSLSGLHGSVLRNNRALQGSGGAVACDGCKSVDLPRDTQIVGNAAARALPPCPMVNSSFYIDNSEKGHVYRQSLPCTCVAGQYSQIEGNSMTCAKCPARSTSTAGSTSAKACACATENYYPKMEAGGGTMECVKCPDEKTSEPGDSECHCKRGVFYLSSPLNGSCSPCPTGADCSLKNGAVIQDLSALPGFWKVDNDQPLFLDCAEAFASNTDRYVCVCVCVCVCLYSLHHWDRPFHLSFSSPNTPT